MEQQFSRIAVKVGSNVLTRRDGTLDVTRMSALVDQIAELHKTGVEVILVSSGAVASGRSEVHSAKKLDSVDQRQLFSAVGQAKLINRYYELFREHGIPVGQVLLKKKNTKFYTHNVKLGVYFKIYRFSAFIVLYFWFSQRLLEAERLHFLRLTHFSFL